MPLPTLKDLQKKGIKKPIAQDPQLNTTRGRPKKEDVEAEVDERDYEIDMEAEIDEQEKVIKIILDENKDLTKADVYKLIRDDVRNSMAKKTTGTAARTGQPLRRVREATEDVYSTLQLRELINDFRTNSREKEKEDDTPQDNNMAFMLPFLQKIQNGGGNAGNIDPNMLLLLMGNQGNKGGNLNQLMMMMMLMSAGSQNQPQHDSSGNVIAGGLNTDMIKLLMTELQKVMEKQTTKPQIDPTMMFMLQMMNKKVDNQPPQNTMRDISLLITALKPDNNSQNMTLELLKQNADLQNQKVIAMIPNEAPEDRVYRSWDMFNKLQGDRRQKTMDEMDYELKHQELALQEDQRRDMLDREERRDIREQNKSDRLIQTATTVLDKVVGEGIGSLIGEVVSARGKGKGKAGSGEPEETFDASLLDDF